MRITYRQITQEKKPGTKTVFTETDRTTWKRITKQTHDNITNEGTQKYFRRLGGSETATYSYTPAGYYITSLVSTSPDKEVKYIRQFRFFH